MSEYISREQLKAALKVINIGIWSDIADIVDSLPVADVAPVVHGRWIRVKHPYGNVNWYKKCSICDKCIDWQDYKYCPYCGAKMDESEGEE